MLHRVYSPCRAGPLALRPADLTDGPLTALPLHERRKSPRLLSVSIQASDFLFQNILDLLIELFYDATKTFIQEQYGLGGTNWVLSRLFVLLWVFALSDVGPKLRQLGKMLHEGQKNRTKIKNDLKRQQNFLFCLFDEKFFFGSVVPGVFKVKMPRIY